MDTYQLRYVLLRLIPKMRVGVCSSDQLKSVSENEFAIITNIQNSSEKGLHWVCFFKSHKMEHVEFFDSIGNDVCDYGLDFENFAKKFSYVKSSHVQFQSNTSDICGIYCLWFLKNRSQGISYQKLVTFLSPTNKSINDHNIKCFIKKIRFPKFSNCGIKCVGCNSQNLSSYCIQKNDVCINIVQHIDK